MTFAKKIVVVLLLSIAVVSFAGPFAAHAVVAVCDTEPCAFGNPLGGDVNDLPGLVCLLVKVLSTKLMPPVVVLMVLWASFLFLTAAGQPGKVIAARTTLLWAVIGAAILLMALPFVALVVSTVGGAAPAACSGTVSTSGAFDVLYALINWFSWLLAILSVAMGLYAGFLYMTSRGEPQKISTANRVIFYAVVGIFVAIIAFSIVSIVNNFIIP
ncbi:hypothetical protein A2Z10_02435 [Candidatus Azambacteria bacterium RBG_16_47_10]|uniref:Yip1 domain-containing protein n=1 Tax=Candidatus Azambacteria bacterium RBG_16_47_10 TaxID=1797292 RepID=A0A1F5B009_9BACT|nr:MAG: hypothetical protein A2Z10_02435 [Candidatus Azambacteria bacterium RBG_16_47_10]